MFIISIDPGSTYIGVSMLELDDNINVINNYTELIDNSKIKINHRFNGLNDYKFLNLNSRLIEIISKYKPIAMAIEMPFIHHGRPQAVIPLARSVETIIQVALELNPSIVIMRPPPSTVKNAVFAHGAAKKESMTTAVGKIIPLTGLESEHEIDATAVNYYLLSMLRTNYFLPYYLEG